MSFRTLCVSRLSDKQALPEDPVAQFTDTLIEIANHTIPKFRIFKNKLPKVPWFNDACKQAIKERKKAQRKLFRNPSTEMRTESQNQTYNKTSKEIIMAKFLFDVKTKPRLKTFWWWQYSISFSVS